MPKTITGWFSQGWQLYNEYSDWTYWLASEWKWWSSETPKITGWFSQGWQLYNEYSDGTAWPAGWQKWWWTSSSNNSSSSSNNNYDYDYNLWEEEEEEPEPVTIVWGYLKNWRLYNRYSDWTSWLASDWDWVWAGSTNWKSLYWNTDLYKNFANKYWDDYANNAFYYLSWAWITNKELQWIIDKWWTNVWTLADEHTMASIENYNKAVNRYKAQGMSDKDARDAAAKDLWNQVLVKWDENIPEWENSTDTDDDDAIASAIQSVIFWEWWEAPVMNDQTVPEWWTTEEWRNKYISDAVDSAVSPYINSVKNSTTVKTSVPEEEDDTFDRNTYFNEKMADKTMHAGWESKDIQDNWLTFAKKYQEPTTAALQDLWYLTDTSTTPDVNIDEENTMETEKPYANWEELLNDFNVAINWIVNSWAWTDQNSFKKAVWLYRDYKKKLENMVANNQISSDEEKELLEQIRTNEDLQTFINNNK